MIKKTTKSHQCRTTKRVGAPVQENVQAVAPVKQFKQMLALRCKILEKGKVRRQMRKTDEEGWRVATWNTNQVNLTRELQCCDA